MPRPHLTTIALVLLLVVPPATAAAQSPGHAAGPAPIDSAATPTEAPPAADPSPSTLLRGLYHTAGVDPGDPAPLPQVAEDEPLVTALEHLADARGRDVPEAELDRARQDADDLPPDLRAALALVVEANAEATERNRDAAEAGTLDRTQSARDALLVARSVDAALPILRQYSLFHASEAQALRLDQARTVDTVVSMATGSEPLQGPGDQADLPGAVLDLYGALGVEATDTDTDRLEAGSEALPDDVRKAATVTTQAQARSAELRAEAFRDLDPGDFATLSDPEAAGALSGPATDQGLDDARAWVGATEGLDRAKLAQAQLTVVTAALQANAILHGETGDEPAEDRGVIDTLWDGIKGLVDRLNPIATARAQAGAGGCPQGSPLADCDNDVWFLDPFGIVVVSGPGTTVYDARYGQATLSDRVTDVLKPLPTDGLEVRSRDVASSTNIVVGGSLPREVAENETERRSIQSLDESTLQRPYYAATLDLGGDDVYVHHTANTLDPADAVENGSQARIDGDRIPLFTSLLVDVGGDDLYDPTLAANRSAGSIAHAGPAGLAVLLDAAGDDTYRGGEDSIATATTLGRSALLDLDGDDTYEAGNRSAGAADLLGSAVLLDDCAAPAGEACRGGNDTVQTAGQSQGWGSLGGVGALVNRGGDDAYQVAGSEGQGAGTSFGLGAFVDVAGDDEGIRPEASGDRLDGLADDDPTAEVVARPNDEPVRGTVWAQRPDGGAGLALEVDHPAALELGPEGLGVIASFERTSAPGVELPGLFFVDGATDTVYDQPYAVTVDLAGFDTYKNNAGGAINLSDAPGTEGAAGTALALDLAGSDRYDGRDADPRVWGVQGAARNGAGLLMDLSRSPDTYVAGDRAQGAAGVDGVGLLLDDGAVEGARDHFRADDRAQGFGRVGGVGALVTLDGDTTYKAGDRAQGFGLAAGAGLLVDRQILATSVTDRPNVPEPSGDDTYEAGEHAQGAAFAGGVGLLADLGGDDTYTVTDLGQGYADPTRLEMPPGVDVKRPQTAADASRGLLVDLSGEDSYEAEASPARAHGYAAEDVTGVRSRALLADFALPHVPLVRLDDVPLFGQGAGAYAGTLQDDVTSTQFPEGEDVFADWDPTGFHDEWLRQGRGDDYVPGETPDGQVKAENGYWEQPRPDDANATASEVDQSVTVPTSDRPSAGLGMDNPPIAAPTLGSDRFFAAAEMVDGFLAPAAGNGTIAGTVVQQTRPNVTLHAHPFDGAECDRDTDLELDDPGKGLVCLEAHVEQAGGLTADPDRNMEVDFDLRALDDDTWRDVGENRTLTYYGSVQETYDEDLGHVGFLELAQNPPAGAPGTNIPNPFTAEPGDLVDAPAADAAAGTDTVGIVLDSEALCAATGGTGYCPDDPGTHDVHAMAWPDGNYSARATVHTISATLTADRSTAQDTTSFGLDNAPRLLGLDVRHPNPVDDEPGLFTLYASEPHRGYEIDIREGPFRPLDLVAEQASTSVLGTPTAGISPVEDRNVTVATATWPGDGEDFPPTDTYRFEAQLNRFEGEMAAVRSLDLAGNASTTTGVALDSQVRGAAAAHVDGEHVVAGGADDDGLRDDVLVLDPDAGDGPTLSTEGALPEPRADAAVAAAGSTAYVFGGRTPGGPTDTIVRVQADGDVQTLSTTLPDPIVDATAVHHPSSDTIYVLGGQGPDGPRDTILSFNPADDSVDTADVVLPEPLTRAGAATHADGTIVVAGGVTDDGRTDAVLALDPADGSVRLSTTLSLPLADAAVLPANDRVYVLGGTTEAGPHHGITWVDPGSDDTSTIPLEVPRPRSDTVATVDAGTVYVHGAGRFVPSDSPHVASQGNVTVDPDPPSLNLTLGASLVGCAEATCPGTGGEREVAVPFQARDEGSGIQHVEADLTAHGETIQRTVIPGEPTPGTFEGAAVRSVAHGARLEVEAVAVDGAGHRSPSDAATYFVDLQPPTATTTLPRVPTQDADEAVQNATVFPVGWRNLSADASHVEVWYRVHGAHADFREGLTVDDPEAGEAEFPAGEVAPDLVGDGTTLDLRVRAVDDAGNVQPLADTTNRTVTLDLEPPSIRSLDVDPGFQRAVIRYELTEPGVVHRATLTGPDGVADTLHRVRTTDQVTFVAPDLDSGTTYDVTLTSLDAARNAVRKTVNFTTESSLSLDWETPEAGAILSDEAVLRFRIGAADVARDDTTRVTLAAVTDNGTEALLDGLPVGVEGNRTDPREPSVSPYPITVDTLEAPEGDGLTLQLVAGNAHGTTTATRTVTIDNTPPTIPPNATPTLEGPRGPAGDGIPWFRGTVHVTEVPATDAVSGVNRTLYGWDADAVDRPLSADGNRTGEADGPPNRTAEGVHAFHHRSIDEAGNAETDPHIHRFGIDTTPPTVDPVVDHRAPDDRNVSLQVNASDGRSGVLHVRTHLAGDDPGPWLPVNGTTTSPTVTLPDEDDAYTVTVAARDRAGNVQEENVTVTYSTRPPALAEGPAVEALSPVAAEVTWTTDKPSSTTLALPGVEADVRVDTVGFTTRHRVVVTELVPGTDVEAEITLEDRAGHVDTSTVNVTTPDDPSPPTAVGNLTAIDTGAGAVAVGWTPATDESGILGYRVQRALDDGPLRTVTNVTRTQVVDHDVDPGATYRYRIQAVDAAGKLGAGANATATPTMPPVIRDPVYDAGSVNGTAVLFLEVTVVERGRPVEAVHAEADGETVELTQVNATDDGLVYQGTVEGSNLTVGDGVDVAFLAEGPETTVRHPQDGFLHVDARDFGLEEDTVPGPGAWALASILVAAIVLGRRRGGDPPGAGSPRTGRDPRNLM